MIYLIKKEFVRGILKGITIDDTMRFPDAKRARSWQVAVNRNSEKGKLPYVVRDIIRLK